MTSQLTAIAAAHHRADLHTAAARSRRTGRGSRPFRSERPSRRWPHLRRRPAVA